ncbi:MAG: UpxY family transcription antiterminator [Bacteroidales bacterium]|nr:UpxY family transcription antiterminator [Bacteroidales bacterium]
MLISEKTALKWYVMRDLKRPNALLPAYKMLQDMGIEVFTPMVDRVAVVGGKRIKKKVPFIPDLLFVHSNQETIDPIVERFSTFQYRYVRGLYHCCMTVPDLEMQRFIRAVSLGENVVYYKPEEITPGMVSKRVRILGGTFDGYEGDLLSVKGRRKKRLLVELQGMFAAGVDVSDCEFLELK